MANEKQTLPKLSETDLPTEKKPLGMYPAPMLSESFDPYSKKGDEWLYQESFIEGYPDSRLLLGLLQKEKLQSRRENRTEAEDHQEMIETIGKAIQNRNKSPS